MTRPSGCALLLLPKSECFLSCVTRRVFPQSVGLFRLAGDGLDRAVLRAALDEGKQVCPSEPSSGLLCKNCWG